jgi:hypothetical protein
VFAQRRWNARAVVSDLQSIEGTVYVAINPELTVVLGMHGIESVDY